MHKEQTIRDAFSHMLDKFQDRKPSHLLFTSFTFASAFFESNVLPLLCGYTIDQLESAKVRPDAINEALETINTLVVCDRSANPDPKGDFRYGLMTVGLERGRFHPKIILMAGTLKDSGKSGLWLSVSSANISMSGWGLQREVVGATAVGVDHARQLQPLLEWLSQQAEAKVALAGTSSTEEGAVRMILRHLLDRLGTDALKQRSNMPSLHLALPAPINPAPAPLLPALAGSNSWDSVTVISPFWSEVPKLIKHINAKQYRLVPSMSASGYGYPTLAVKPPTLEFQCFKTDGLRYTHAKAILLTGKGKYVLCIGSANFTSAAMLNNPQMMNVEAMLRYRLDRDPWQDILMPLAYEPGKKNVDPEEGAPLLPPFDAEVLYDWKRQQFICKVSRNAGSTLASVVLDLGKITETITLAPPQPLVIAAVLRRPARSYKLSYEDPRGQQLYVGLVTQLNADSIQLGYSPRPRLDLILASLHRLMPGQPGKTPRQAKSRRASELCDDSVDPDGAEPDEPVYDLFSFFRATEKLLQHYRADRKTGRPYASMGNTLYTLYQAVWAQAIPNDTARIGRYILMAELRAATEELGAGPLPDDTQVRNNMIATIDAELTALTAVLLPLLQQSPHFQKMFGNKKLKPQAAVFLQWFKEQLAHNE